MVNHNKDNSVFSKQYQGETQVCIADILHVQTLEFSSKVWAAPVLLPGNLKAHISKSLYVNFRLNHLK